MTNTIFEEIEEMYRYRSILRALVEKYLFGHYKNSFLGFTWHFFHPLIMLVVYYFAYTYVKHSTMANGWLFIASAVFIFHFLLHNIEGGSGCIVSHSGMIKKLYFPKALIPLSKVISSFIVCVIGNIIVIVGMIIIRYPINIEAILFLPIVLILAFIFAFGITLLLSALVVYVRDIEYFIGSISMVFFLMTPMYFEATEKTGLLGAIVWLNPLTYYVEMSRSILYWGTIPELKMILISIGISFVTLLFGIVVFHKLKNCFVELI